MGIVIVIIAHTVQVLKVIVLAYNQAMRWSTYNIKLITCNYIEPLYFYKGFIMTTKKHIIYAFIAVLLTAVSAYKHVQNNDWSTNMVAIDGDTFRYEGKYYRLLGIDSPEKGNTCYFDAQKELQRVLDKGVNIEYYNKDKYGRQLVVLFDEDYKIDYNKQLLQSTGYYTARYNPIYKYTKYTRKSTCIYK